MALFKILKGNRVNLTNCPWTEGYAYFCEDTQEFFIDHKINNAEHRSKLNVAKAEMIYKSDGNNTINISAEDIQNLLNSSVRYTAQTLTTN